MMRCQLCGYDYDPAGLDCHSKCPMADGCHIICCPNCGYQVVDSEKSSAVNVLRRVRAWFDRASDTDQVYEADRIPLSRLPAGTSGEITQIDETDSGRLMKLAALGIAPGSELRLQQRRPAYVVWLGETQLSLDSAIADRIFMRPYS